MSLLADFWLTTDELYTEIHVNIKCSNIWKQKHSVCARMWTRTEIC